MAVNRPQGNLGTLFPPSYHRPWIRYVEPTPGAETPQEQKPADTTDWKAESRKWEARAKENLAASKAHEDAAKANEEAAKRLAEIEDQQKTDAQKHDERITALEAENAALKLSNLRAEVAAAKSVPIDILTGTTRAEMEKAADAAIAWAESQKPKPASDDPWKSYFRVNPAGTSTEQITPGMGSLRAGYAQLTEKS